MYIKRKKGIKVHTGKIQTPDYSVINPQPISIQVPTIAWQKPIDIEIKHYLNERKNK